uniref:Uncharacterized protein n=1 Tax=Globodera rostochiensis TaxID=31243 RepID=A0A914HUH3_GLORO
MALANGKCKHFCRLIKCWLHELAIMKMAYFHFQLFKLVLTAREAQGRIMLAAQGHTGLRLFFSMRQLTHHFGLGMYFGIEEWAAANTPVPDNYGVAQFNVQILAVVDYLVAKQDPAEIYHGSTFLDITADCLSV